MESNEEFQIRRVTESDVPVMTNLLADYVFGFYQQHDKVESDITLHIRFILDHPREGIQFLLQTSGEPAGFATLYYSYSTLRLQRIAILNDLFISAPFRGRGYGEALFKHCLHYAKEAGVAYLQWETTKDNVIAQRLYEKMGGELSDLLVYEIRFSGEPPK